MSEPYAIEVSGLTKRFGALTAVDGLDLQVRPGEIFGLVGPDGAGKTTTMRLLTGIMDSNSGSARVAGYDVFREAEKMKPNIGYMPQRFSLYGDLTVSENLKFFARIYHVPEAERVERERRLLEFSRLEPFRNRLAQDLSGGMKQKLALACTLIHTPKVLFLDEPTTGVDPVSRREFWMILYDLLKQGVTILVSTPYMDEAERCGRVALMSSGRIAVCDTPEDLKRRMRGRILELVAHPVQLAREALSNVSEAGDVQVFGDRLHVVVQDVESGSKAVASAMASRGVEVVSLREVAPSLEDIFMSSVSEHRR